MKKTGVLRNQFAFYLLTLSILLSFFSISPKATASSPLLSFSDCKITSSKPGWNTVGFPIQQIFDGGRLERLPFSGSIKAVIIPVDFPNYQGKSEEIISYSKNFTDETNDYFKTVSYGKIVFKFTVLSEYIRMSKKAEEYDIGTWGRGDYQVYYKEALTNAAQKFDLNGYDVAYVIAAPQTARAAITPGPAFNFPVQIGTAQIPKGSATGGMDPGIAPWRWMVHETGHLFGLVDLYNAEGAMAGQSDSEIHQPFGWWDIMSMNWGTFALELNAWFRIQTTWLPEADVYCLDSLGNKNLELDISPLRSLNGKRALVIRVGQERVIVAEFRTITKYDPLDNLVSNSGILIYEVNGAIPATAAPINILRKENLISKTPPLRDVALKVGEYVETNGLIIGVSKQANNSASIRIATGNEILSTKSQLRIDKGAADKPMLETKKLAKKTTIICVKGKLSKKVTSLRPACPQGFKKKLTN